MFEACRFGFSDDYGLARGFIRFGLKPPVLQIGNQPICGLSAFAMIGRIGAHAGKTHERKQSVTTELEVAINQVQDRLKLLHENCESPRVLNILAHYERNIKNGVR